MNRRVLPFGIAVELLSSFLLWGLAPTDGVRVWYPSVWAYMGEHCLPWGACMLLSVPILGKYFGDNLSTALACIVSELTATLCVWFVFPGEGHFPKPWWTGKFSDYVAIRWTVWFVLGLLALFVFFVRNRRNLKTTERAN